EQIGANLCPVAFRGIGEHQRLERGLARRIASPIAAEISRCAGGDEQGAPGLGQLKERIERADQPPVRGDVHVEALGKSLGIEMRSRRKARMSFLSRARWAVSKKWMTRSANAAARPHWCRSTCGIFLRSIVLARQ